eukprot:gene19546-26228_t
MTHLFVDGAALKNGKVNYRGGIGVWFGDGHPGNVSAKFSGDAHNKVTNQVMELTAAITGLQKVIELDMPRPPHVFTDSDYTIKCATQWYKGWQKNGWLTAKKEPVLNKDLIVMLVELAIQTGAAFTHVPSHRKETARDDDFYVFWYGNSRADELATRGARS